MKIKAKLFGTLGQKIKGYQSSAGMEIDLPDGSTVSEFLEKAGLFNYRDIAVTMDGLILKADDELKDGAFLQILQLVQGG